MTSRKAENLSRKVTPEIINQLEEILGKDNVNISEMDRILYSHDLAPLPSVAGIAFDNIPDVVVRPSTVDQVAAVVKLAHKNGIAIVPRGASTWGLGGSMPVAAGILLDMSSGMNKIIELDKTNMSIKVQSGCIWGKLIDACEKEGLLVGSYPSSFPSATVAGWISTSGIGPGGYKYGAAVDNVLNMKVVLADGTVIETGYDNVANNMSGYNLNSLFSGAEGTLGVIVEVTLRVYPRGIVRPLAYNFKNLKEMGVPINKIVNHPSLTPLHIAWSDHNHFENQRKAGIDEHKGIDNLLLVTLQGAEEFVKLEEQELDKIVEESGGVKMPYEVADHEWDERCYEYRVRKIGIGSIPAEVVVEVQHWAEFVDECYDAFDVMKMDRGGIVGMIADRSTAMFMPYYFKDDETLLGMVAFAFNFYLGDRALLYGGRSLGFGVFFASNLDLVRERNSTELMRDLKTFLDPNDIMNPGHLVCGKTRFGINLDHKLMGIAGSLMQGVKKLLPQDKIGKLNKERFHYDHMEEEKLESRKVTYGRGDQ
ncbi:MAG: FAD-binding oxidoreductase [Thermoplasmatales archaeon]|jgi:glycolate oxidase|nr:FAD-binding oxidoreductase [Thermoplasmatales archaeon]